METHICVCTVLGTSILITLSHLHSYVVFRFKHMRRRCKRGSSDDEEEIEMEKEDQEQVQDGENEEDAQYDNTESCVVFFWSFARTCGKGW